MNHLLRQGALDVTMWRWGRWRIRAMCCAGIWTDSNARAFTSKHDACMVDKLSILISWARKHMQVKAVCFASEIGGHSWHECTCRKCEATAFDLLTMPTQFVLPSQKSSLIYIPPKCFPWMFHWWREICRRNHRRADVRDSLTTFCSYVASLDSRPIPFCQPQLSFLWVLPHHISLSTDGRVRAGPVLCSDPAFEQFLWKHLHAGSRLAPHAALPCLVSLDHWSCGRYLAHPTCGVYASLDFTRPTSCDCRTVLRFLSLTQSPEFRTLTVLFLFLTCARTWLITCPLLSPPSLPLHSFHYLFCLPLHHLSLPPFSPSTSFILFAILLSPHPTPPPSITSTVHYIVFAGAGIWGEGGNNRGWLCSGGAQCHHHEPPHPSRLDVSLVLSAQVQLPSTGEDLPQGCPQSCAWLWWVNTRGLSLFDTREKKWSYLLLCKRWSEMNVNQMINSKMQAVKRMKDEKAFFPPPV